MRCFIAVELPEKIKDILKKLQEDIGDNNAKIKWVKGFHLTLKFFREISENKVEKIKKRLENFKFKDFKLNLSKIGVFPDDKFIRVIWVGIRQKGKIIELQKNVDRKLIDIFEPEKNFKGHVTLGRVKFVRDKKKLIDSLKLDVEGDFKVENIKLIKSELKEKGPVYTELEVFG